MADKLFQTDSESPAAVPEAVAHTEWDRVRAQYTPHLLSILLGVLVVGGALTVYNMRQTARDRANQESARMYVSARSMKDMDELIARYPSSAYAPLAVLRVAKGLFDEGSYATAQERYVDFTKRFPEHAGRPAAEMGIALCLEARNRYEEARAGFATFTKTHAKHYLVPQAVLAQGRCMVELGRGAEAKALYEDYIVAHPESAYVPKFRRAVENVEKRMKAPAPAVATTPAGPSMPSVVPGATSPLDLGPRLKPVLPLPAPAKR